MTDRMIDRKRQWGKWEYSVAGVVTMVAGIAIGGPVYCHRELKSAAVQTAVVPLKSQVKTLEGRKKTLEEETRNLTSERNVLKTQKELAEDYARGTGKAAADAIAKSEGIEGKVESVYQTQSLKYPSEIKDFVYNFEKGEEGRIYLDIKPVSEKSLKEVVEFVIPENYKERKELALAIPGFFDKYRNLARKNGLSERLTDYTSVDGTPQSNGVWNLVFVDKNGNEKTVQYYPGGD